LKPYSAPTGLVEILLHDPQGVALAKVFRPYGAIGKSQALTTDYLFYNTSRLSDDPINHLQATQTPGVKGSFPGLQHPTSKFNLHKLQVSEAISKKCVKQEDPAWQGICPRRIKIQGKYVALEKYQIPLYFVQ
jgi:hypothetical protein